jgi:hypothetical protein
MLSAEAAATIMPICFRIKLCNPVRLHMSIASGKMTLYSPVMLLRCLAQNSGGTAIDGVATRDARI